MIEPLKKGVEKNRKWLTAKLTPGTDTDTVASMSNIDFVGISRFASCVDGLMEGYFKDPEFQKIMEQDLENGQHRNHTDNELYFTDSFFHHPEELRSEIIAVGFQYIATHAIEGIGYKLQDFDESWRKKEHREFLLHILRKIDKEPSLMGASPHIMCVAAKK